MSTQPYRVDGEIWDAEHYLARVPEVWREGISKVISELKNQDGRLTVEFGKESLLLGVRNEKLGRRNILLVIKTSGEVWIFGILAGAGLSESQEGALLTEIAKRPFLAQASAILAKSARTKVIGPDPSVGIESFGTGDALVESIISLLKDYDRIVNG